MRRDTIAALKRHANTIRAGRSMSDSMFTATVIGAAYRLDTNQLIEFFQMCGLPFEHLDPYKGQKASV